MRTIYSLGRMPNIACVLVNYTTLQRGQRHDGNDDDDDENTSN